MRLNWFLMTEWSNLLHQLNSISPSLKDPVKLAHISGRRHPFPSRAAPETQSSAASRRPLTASVSFIGSSGEPTLKTANWKHTCLYSGSRRREAAPTGPNVNATTRQRKMEITATLNLSEQRRQLRLRQKHDTEAQISVTTIRKRGFIIYHISVRAESHHTTTEIKG